MQQPLAEDLQKGACHKQAADPGIGDAALYGGSHIGLHGVIGADTENAEKHEQSRDNGHHHQAVSGGFVHRLLVPLSQALAQQGVDTHAHTHGKADLQILNGEGQGQGRYRTVRDLGHINAVHHIIKGLHQHGKGHRQRHIGQQLSHRHGAHFVFLYDFLR